MIEAIAIALRDETVFQVYVWAMMAVMIGPMLLLTVFYHRRVGRTEGGRRLMKEQARNAPATRNVGKSLRNMTAAGGMDRDIASGRYGDETRRLQNRTYLYVGLWVLANVVMWAIPLVSMSMYPDPANPPGLRQPAAPR